MRELPPIGSFWRVVEGVLKEWQQHPYTWATERDVQAVLFCRLSRMLKSHGVGPVYGKDKTYDWGGYESGQPWGRVACEGVTYRPRGGTPVRPDIVVWRNPEDPGEDFLNWRMYWACELKYRRGRTGEHDRDKLAALIKGEKLDYGCAVHLEPGPLRGPARRFWVRESGLGGRLRWYHVINHAFGKRR